MKRYLFSWCCLVGTILAGPPADDLPSDPVTLLNEARRSSALKDYRRAERAYERLLAADPKNPGLLKDVGIVYFQHKKFTEAGLALRQVIALAPADGEAHRLLGIMAYSVTQYKEAVAELTEAVRLDPKDAVAHNYLGISASQQGQQTSAVSELKNAIALKPDYADAHFNLAVVYVTQQPPDKVKARQHYQRAMDLGSEADSALEKMFE